MQDKESAECILIKELENAKHFLPGRDHQMSFTRATNLQAVLQRLIDNFIARNCFLLTSFT